MAPNNVGADRRQWREVARDPEPGDLGYDIADWEVVRARKNDRGHLMFLPENEERLREEAFIVAESDAVCDVGDRL